MAYNILIVDDSSTIRAMIKRTIKLAQVPVAEFYEAPDGRVALQMMDAHKVDLVLADLNMPEMNGVEMTEQMRQDPKLASTPVIVISAEPNIHKLESLTKDNIKGYLRKPFTPEGVRDLISRTLGVDPNTMAA